jgi:peptidoglycan/LPS O-acetylase OafA/YrhL
MFEFRRITTQKRFIPQIDGLRFVAISSVVLLHIYAALERGAVPEPIRWTATLPSVGWSSFL